MIKGIIQNALQRADKELAGVRLKDITPDQNFFGGKGSALDSLNLVSFIFILEEEFTKGTGKLIKISTQDILSKDEAPFRNLASLEAWLTRRASETK